MTIENKAVEITTKFGYAAGTHLNDLVLSIAKRSAIICCDEVIAEIEDLQQNCVMEFPLALEYWNKVKQHIESL